MKDLVTVVIPVYNTPHEFFKKSVDSILKQTYRELEILIVDDGSTDEGIRKIGTDYMSKDSRVHYFWKKNGGTASALNYALKYASGKWFKWWSSDDIMKPNCIQFLLDHARSLFDNDKVIIFTSEYDIIGPQDEFIQLLKEPNPNEMSIFKQGMELFKMFFGSVLGGIFTIDLAEEVGFDESVGYQEDYAFYLNAVVLNDVRLHMVEGNVFQYRLHPGQLTQTKKEDAAKKANEIRVKVMEKIGMRMIET